jgi:hypothetical protein
MMDRSQIVKCFDKFGEELREGDYVDVQTSGKHKIYKKEDGQLYFKPYGREDRVSDYFSDDMIKCDDDTVKPDVIHIIVSRDKGIICGTRDKNKVEGLIKDQTLFEEMGGGRPSVFSKTIEIV